VASLGETTDIQALCATLRERKQAMTASASPSTSTITETDHNVTTRDGSQIIVRSYKAEGGGGAPVLVVLHGCGWVLGDLDNEALLCLT
jgi:acetyl esterase/lipase